MRASRIRIDADALLNNLKVARQCAPESKVIAMVKANAYGCGLSKVVKTLLDEVDGFGVACIEEALAIRALGIDADVVLFEGFFDEKELSLIEAHDFQFSIHHQSQLESLLNYKSSKALTVWLKINTGMNRLGFKTQEVAKIYDCLKDCAWVKSVRLMTHFAEADELTSKKTEQQLLDFESVTTNYPEKKSVANSAGILAWPRAHADVIRPGIMLYGSSPLESQTAHQLGLKPVMHFESEIIALNELACGESVGYGSSWVASRPTLLAVVAVGYGDGYPRVVAPGTRVYVNGQFAPIVGRVSMDMLTIDVTEVLNVRLRDEVELWGAHVPIDEVAEQAGTIAYELLCKVTDRVR